MTAEQYRALNEAQRKEHFLIWQREQREAQAAYIARCAWRGVPLPAGFITSDWGA